MSKQDFDPILMRLVAKTQQGLEQILADELTALGASNVEQVVRGVTFEGDKRLLYRANLELRTAIRILYPIASFNARTEEHLYQGIYNIDWERYMGVDDTLAIDAAVHSNYFTHSQYAALKTKDAIVDQFRNKFGRRPSIDTIQPTLRINIYIHDDYCEVSLDSSGDSLHKRGINRETLEAPLNEVLAAGMIMLSGWKGERTFIDPMCGSGTLLLEAAMIAYNIPPLLHRDFFGFKQWPNYDKALWNDVVNQAKANIITARQADIIGYDSAFQAIRTTERNIGAAGLDGKIVVERLAFEKQPVHQTPSTIIMNPPYNERLKIEELEDFYKSIGDTLKRKFQNSEAWLITSNLDALKTVGLRTSKRLDLSNGGLDCKFVKYELY